MLYTGHVKKPGLSCGGRSSILHYEPPAKTNNLYVPTLYGNVRVHTTQIVIKMNDLHIRRLSERWYVRALASTVDCVRLLNWKNRNNKQPYLATQTQRRSSLIKRWKWSIYIFQLKIIIDIRYCIYKERQHDGNSGDVRYRLDPILYISWIS